ncbi:MAG: polymer-forming cytoskeletal protein [Comamonadaceae bacterium]|nr:MAG: polymer-forming cytoskeletal protein [Comamonadaceae bacterium]
MAMQTPFFGKREPDAVNQRYGPGSGQGLNGPAGAQAQPHAGVGNAQGAGAAASSHAVAQGLQATAQAASAASSVPAKEGGSKLTVGPNIKLKGVEITDCDTLVVEGTVEATMDSRVIQIAEHGAFKGSAEIDVAEIHGEFDGNLTVRQKLVIHSTGKVTGKIRYGKLVIEEGGQLSGEIQFGALAAVAKVLAVPRPGLQAAA